VSLLILLAGFVVAIIVASVTYRLLTRSRVRTAASAAQQRPDLGTLLFSEGQRPAAIVLSTIVALLILSGFLYTLYPDFFGAFRTSRVFLPTYLGIIVVAVLRTRKQEGWRSLGSLILLLIAGAAAREIWLRRPPTPPKLETPAVAATSPQVYPELIVIASKDGSWTPWIDTYGLGGRWNKATRNDFIVGTEAGEAYRSSDSVPRGRYFRFRSASDRESRIQIVGQRLSYVPAGVVPEPADVELSPPGPREDSLTVKLTPYEWSETIEARGSLVELELIEGSTDLIIRGSDGRETPMFSRLGERNTLPGPVEAFSIKPTGWKGPIAVTIRFRRP
jgi:hypothetical protein